MNQFREVLLPDMIPGRLYLHSMPGRYEHLREELAEVQRLRVSGIVSLVPLDEIREKSPEYIKAVEAGNLPCALWRHPVCDYQGPDDDRAFWELAVQVAALLRDGEKVLVHCGAGIGRTGMFAIAALLALGLAEDDARSRVEAAGSRPERPAQEAALRRIAQLRATSAKPFGTVATRFASRNHALGFAERTRKNLEHIEKAFQTGADVHVVTQLANSLLGLIVFPWEKHFVARVETLKLDELVTQGWPQWAVSRGTCDTLGQLVRHLRNAVAHGHMTFSSDSRSVGEVAIEVADYRPGAAEPHWCARIEAAALRKFCTRFIQLLDDTIR